MASQLRDIIEFFDEIGLYDVVLPFLLAFTIVFAIFEKTRVLGTEDGKPKKNLNAIAAFAIAFLVVASSRLVEILTEVSSNMVVLLFLSVLFLLLVGSFFKEKEEGVYLKGGYKLLFMAIMFIGISGIFLDALHTDDGRTWLEALGDYTGGRDNDRLIGSVILLTVIVIFMTYVLKDEEKDSDKKKDSH